MAGDFNKPVVTDPYVDTLAAVRAIIADVAKGLDPALTLGTLNTPTNAIRWNSANKYWEKFNGTSWAALETTYAISISGNAATATTAAACSGNSNTATNATTAGTANALNSANNYSVNYYLGFNNGGVGSGFIQSNESTYGMIFKPSINGSSTLHLWTNAFGINIGNISANNCFVAPQGGFIAQGLTNLSGSMGYDSTSRGLYLWGKASSGSDFQLLNSAGSIVASVPTGTTNFGVIGTLSAGALASAGKVSGATSTGTYSNSALVGIASGLGGWGVYGSATTAGYGGLFEATTVAGVRGNATTGDGVFGYQTGATGQGVRGVEAGGGVGVYCQSSSTGVPLYVAPRGSAPTTSLADGSFYTSPTGQPYVRISGVWRQISVI